MSKWEPLARQVPTAESVDAIWRELKHKRNMPESEIRKAVNASMGDMWGNKKYIVIVRREGGWVHLSIRRRDQQPVSDWRDKQHIKNQLVGPECEGVELYPAESRLVDAANQYHLWCIEDESFRFPCGFSHRLTGDEPLTSTGGQRPHEH